MKKIAFLIDDMNNFAGAPKITIEIANKLAEDYEIYLISVSPLINKIYRIHPNIKLLSLNLSHPKVALNYIHGFFPLNKMLKENKINTLFLVGTNVSLFSLVKYINRNTKMIFSDHACLKGTLSDRKATFIRKYSHLFCDLTIVLTEKNLVHYMQYLDAKKDKLVYIYNPIELPKQQRMYDFKSNKIITVGRLSEEKGFDLLVQVAAELLKLNADWQWDIYGDGSLFNDINQSIKLNHLEKHVRLMGSTDRIMDIYNDYGVYVLTSYREGLPLVLLEAKACKLPIISFDIDTGPSEIVRNDMNGYLIKPYNIHEMAASIHSLLIDENKRIQFSENAYLDIEKFEPEPILNKWKSIIERY